MSWVSILEDAIERFEEGMDRLRTDLPPNPERVPVEQWKSAVGLLARGEAMLAEAAKHLDLATDPAIDLAHALNESVDEARELKRKVAEFQQTCFSLMSALRTREGEIKELRNQLKALRTQTNQLEARLKEAMAANAAGVYDAFSKDRNGKRK
jgi:chromosome segregation ATPase